MAQQYWWKPRISSMPSMEVGSGVQGGLVRIRWGQIGFTPDSFVSEPPAKADISLDWGANAANTLHLFDGEIYRRKYNTVLGSQYDIFEPEFATKVLAEGVDVKGDAGDPDVTVYQPLVIGTVTHMALQRTGLASEQKYYMPDFATYSFSDDGVPIDDHWAIAGGYAERSVDIVGEATGSGTGNMTTLNDVCTWAAAKMGLDYVNVHGGDVDLNCMITSQQFMTDFLDKIAYYCCYKIDIKNGALYLIDMAQDNGEQAVNKDSDSAKITYSWPMPAKNYKAAWTLRKFNPTTGGLVDDPQKVNYYTENPAGQNEVTITPYDQSEADVMAKITAIASQEAKVVVSLSLPLERFPATGERISFIDRKGERTITGYLRVGPYSINYKTKNLDIKGLGEIAFA